MKLSYLPISSESTASQVRTYALWNIGAAIERLRAQLEYSEADRLKSAGSLVDRLSEQLIKGKSYDFLIKSGRQLTGEFKMIRGPWIVIRGRHDRNDLIAADSIEAILSRDEENAQQDAP